MVKTPKARHSKTTRDPVTIDLDPASVSRVTDPEAARPTPEVEAAGNEATPGAGNTDPLYDDDHAPETSPEGVSTAAQEREWSPRDEAAEEAAEIAAGRAAAEAERREQERQEAAAEQAPVLPARSGGSGTGTAVLGGVIGAILALIVAGLLQWAGVLPGMKAADTNSGDEVATLRQDVSALQDKVAQLGDSSGEGDAVAELGQKVVGLETSLASLKDTVGQLQQGTASQGDASTDMQALKDQIAELQKQVQQTAQSAADNSALQGRVDQLAQGIEAAKNQAGQADTNAQKLSALQTRLQQLGDKVQAQQEQPRVALLVAATALKSAVDRGVAFDSELQAYQSVAPDSGPLDALQKYAGQGVPTRAALAEEASDVATRTVSAGAVAGNDSGFVSRLWGSAKSLVVVRPVGQVQGDDVPSIAARFEADVKAGDYGKALAEYDKLPEASKKAATEFAGKLRARQGADEIMDKALSGAVKAG